MSKFLKLVNNVIKFSSFATTQYQLYKIASDISSVSDTAISFNNPGLEKAFSKFIDCVMKLEDILSGKNAENEETSKEEYLTEIVEGVQFWSSKVREAAQEMKVDDWLSEDTDAEALVSFMISANEAIDKAIETYNGMNVQDLIEQNKADISNEEKAIPGTPDFAEHAKGNIRITNNTEARIRANKNFMNKLQFLRKINPQAPEWLSFKESVKRSLDKRRQLINSKPEFRKAWTQLNNKKYKIRRELHEQKVERLKADLERYKADNQNYNNEKLIERTENLLKNLGQKFIFTDKSREHQKDIAERVKDKGSMMGCLRRISLILQGSKNVLKEKLKKKYKTPEWEAKFEVAKKSENYAEINKLKDEINLKVENDPDLLNYKNGMLLIQDYTLRVKSVNMRRGDGVKPETVSIAVNAVELGQQIIPKIAENYPKVVEQIKLCNEIISSQVKDLLSVDEELPPQTVYQPTTFVDEEESPDTIKEMPKFNNEAMNRRLEQLKKLATDVNMADDFSSVLDSIIENVINDEINFDLNIES